MPRPETSRGIVRKVLADFNKTGRIPEEVPTIEAEPQKDEVYVDLTKPYRAAFEAIFLARIAGPALDVLPSQIAMHSPTDLLSCMPSIHSIDLGTIFEDKVEQLRTKTNFVLNQYEECLSYAGSQELRPDIRLPLPSHVITAYEHLEPETELHYLVENNVSTLSEEISKLMEIAITVYPGLLDEKPSAKQMVQLVQNSYDSYMHLLPGFHNSVPTPFTKNGLVRGVDYDIDMSGENHRIVLINPAQYIELEDTMREDGDILSVTTRCPFAAPSSVTEPFLDAGVEPLPTNPFRHTFETLLRNYIAA